jgi:hypothetical protein
MLGQRRSNRSQKPRPSRQVTRPEKSEDSIWCLTQLGEGVCSGERSGVPRPGWGGVASGPEWTREAVLVVRRSPLAAGVSSVGATSDEGAEVADRASIIDQESAVRAGQRHLSSLGCGPRCMNLLLSSRC